MSTLSRIILPGLLGILAITISPLIIQEIYSQEELLVLNNGIISTASNDYPISSNFEIRVFHDGELIRIKGITASGYPYYAYQKMIDGDAELRGKIFIDGKMFSIVNKVSYIQKSEPEPEQEPVAKMLILIDHTSFGYYTQSYNVITKVFDAFQNPLKQFEHKSGLLEGIDIQIILTDPDGNIFRTYDGTTNALGYFNERFQWQYGDPVGQYNVTVIADDGINKITKQYDTSYKGYHPYYSSSDNPTP